MVRGCVAFKIKKIAEELSVLGSGNNASMPRTWLTYFNKDLDDFNQNLIRVDSL